MMKTIGLAGAACTLIGTAGASADAIGISVELVDSSQGSTYRVYAEVEDGDRIDAVFGNSTNDLMVGAGGGLSFYQNGLGGATSLSINSAFFPLAPSVEWDSYVTIGSLYADGYPFGSNELKTIGIDFTSFEAGGSIESNNGSWFVTPVDPQGGEIGGRVLLGQFTVLNGTGDAAHDLAGVINVQGKDADGNTFQSLGMSIAPIPAPGAIALLGVAGLAGRRRRR
ncbi:MAG: hypothetical protein QF733_00395 [Phycisphaerales bacterium]|jgi:MYXO-CTERM domain-containing protein|nr:hypothetical protein [Phycisphaerales bacterium]